MRLERAPLVCSNCGLHHKTIQPTQSNYTPLIPLLTPNTNTCATEINNHKKLLPTILPPLNQLPTKPTKLPKIPKNPQISQIP
jgi:hypothetical protein